MNRRDYILPHPLKAMYFALLLLFCLNTSPSLGQNDPSPDSYLLEDRSATLMSDKDWEEWSKKREGSKYWAAIQKAKKGKNKEERQATQGQNFGFLKALATFLLILIGIIVSFFVVRQLMGVQLRPRNRKINRQGNLTIDLEEIEDRLEEVILEDFIQEAIRKENYALAIRLYYLEALKVLSQQKQISWKKDKTNRDYLFEMRNSKRYPAFQEITRLFERVWYGNRSIDAPTFYEIAPYYQTFIAEVETQNLSTTS